MREGRPGMQGTSRSELAGELDRCARLCEETARVYVERQGDAVRTDVVSGLLLAAAAMDTAAGVVDDDAPTTATALLIVRTLVDDAIGAAERRGLDESLLHCVVALRKLSRSLDG